jgi:hypothetical protein
MRAALWIALSMTGCGAASSPASPTGAQHDVDASVYLECSSYCVRPSDCAIAYSTDDRCPPGFLCALAFRCVGDGGAGD